MRAMTLDELVAATPLGDQVNLAFDWFGHDLQFSRGSFVVHTLSVNPFLIVVAQPI